MLPCWNACTQAALAWTSCAAICECADNVCPWLWTEITKRPLATHFINIVIIATAIIIIIIIIIITTTIIISITTASLQVALASGYGSFDFARNAAKRLWELPKGSRRPRPI